MSYPVCKHRVLNNTKHNCLNRLQIEVFELEGKYPQIYDVCHVWTFDFQLFSDVRFANF